MQTKARYLLLLLFVVIVIGAMFVMYSTINSPEEIVYFDSKPSWWQKSLCVIKGGKVEVTVDTSGLPEECLDNQDSNIYNCLPAEIFACHYH